MGALATHGDPLRSRILYDRTRREFQYLNSRKVFIVAIRQKVHSNGPANYGEIGRAGYFKLKPVGERAALARVSGAGEAVGRHQNRIGGAGGRAYDYFVPARFE